MNKTRWIETVTGVALVAAWAVVAWTTEVGLREQDRADEAHAAARRATSQPVALPSTEPVPTLAPAAGRS